MPSKSKPASSSSGPAQLSSRAEVDEYADEEDLGYVREHIRGQAAFRATELRFGDGHDAMQLYHQAKASQEYVSPECHCTWLQPRLESTV